jgi:carotenoid 1,2-hydratase
LSDGGPRFDIPIGPNGYAWWYLDGLSDDGRHGITIIALVGSVFSPYYAWARRRGPVPAEHHNAMNVALYGRPGSRWAMTERGVGSLTREAEAIRIGPSSLRWENGRAIVDLAEIAVPIPKRIRGRVTIIPEALNTADFAIDAEGRHRWWPVAPCARIIVDMEHPNLRWEGSGYLDSNRGAEPLEDRFRSWNWSRAEFPDGDCAVFYDLVDRDGQRGTISRRFTTDGRAEDLEPPPLAPLSPIFWGVPRTTRGDADGAAELIRTLEDTPFYARSATRTVIGGRPAIGVHESLDLTRFSRNWVKCLLPFRMPRRP